MRITNQLVSSKVKEFALSNSNREDNNSMIIKIDENDFHFKWSKKSLFSEYLILKELKGSFFAEHIYTPTPFYYDEEHNVLVSNFIEHQTFFNYVWNSVTFLNFGHFKDFTKLYKIQDWLICFHQPTTFETVTPEENRHSVLIQEINKKLDFICNNSPTMLDSHTIQAINKILIRQRFDFSQTKLVRIHGDLTFQNILINDNKDVFIIDFDRSTEGLAIEDLVQLWGCIWEINECCLFQSKELTEYLIQLKQIIDCRSPESLTSTSIPRVSFYTFLMMKKAIERIYESIQEPIISSSFSTRVIHYRIVKHYKKLLSRLVKEIHNPNHKIIIDIPCYD